MFDVMCNPFKNGKTEHKCFKVLDEMGMLIRPKTIHVGKRINDKLQNGCVIAENIPVNILYSVFYLKGFLNYLMFIILWEHIQTNY